jgi:iron complex transport system substrate-binding protein
MNKIICMSSSQVAALYEIGADSLVAAVSGLKYLTNQRLHERNCPDIGYEASIDYEKVLTIKPDLLVTYTISASEPQYIAKLKSLGIPVLVIFEQCESHPLAKAEYVRLFGALTGRQERADSCFRLIKDRYCALADSLAGSDRKRLSVLMNIPYADAWYLPGSDGYMSRLIRDAGGQVLGAQKGSVSGVITMEDAYSLSLEADMWLCPGYCRTREQLATLHHLFPHFGPLAKGLPIYNNILRATSGGGNDFWESGAVRPDLILKDLRAIFQAYKKELSAGTADNLSYFIELSE